MRVRWLAWLIAIVFVIGSVVVLHYMAGRYREIAGQKPRGDERPTLRTGASGPTGPSGVPANAVW